MNVIPTEELENWKKVERANRHGWVADMTAKGANGKLLLDGATALIVKYAGR